MSRIEARRSIKNIQDQNTTNHNNNNNNKNNNNNNDNNAPVICYKLKSIDNALSDTWIDKKITDEQVMYLGQQLKELMVEAGCIN